MQIVPVFQAGIILSNSAAGIVFFRDLRDSPIPQKIMFAFGALMAAGGVNLLLLKANGRSGGAGGAGKEQEGAASLLDGHRVPTVDTRSVGGAAAHGVGEGESRRLVV